MNSNKLERVLNDLLEDNTLEEVFELFDLTPEDVFLCVYEDGLIDDEILKEYLATDGA